MNISKRTSIIVAAVMVLVITVASVLFFSSQKEENFVPSADNYNAAEATPEPTEEPEKETTPVEPSVKTPEEALAEVEKSKEFNDARETSNFSEEQVQEVLKTSTEYAYNSLTNTYFLSGQWVEDGMPNILDDATGNFFTTAIRENIKSWDTNPETGKDIAEKVNPLVFYVYPNGNVTAHPACKVNEDGGTAEEKEISCPMGGLELTEMTYAPTLTEEEKPGLQVKFSATTQVPVLSDGKDSYVEVQYDYNLNFVLNEDFEEVTNPNKYVINAYEVQINYSEVRSL